MVSASRIGALRVDLGANTAAFEKGMSRAERRMAFFSKRMERVGKKISGIGKSLTVGITAPVAAAATAFGVAANKMAGDAREIANSAQVAGESFEEFQRQAFAAKSVGIEMEKLGDIFKDVRDRVGDFAATGGGPMADFFENIAPKVGITADAFKGLSGKDSLQLYFDSLKKANVSQEEMVFYLEAMASDATNLIPLLEKNGEAFGKLGENANVISDEERANLEKYTKAQEALGQATQKLTIALVESGILETITDLVKRFAAFTSELAETNPGILKAGVVFAGLAAAVGPVVTAIGGLMTIAPGVVTAINAIKAASLLLMANPVILAFAAVIAGIYLAWQNWDKIEPYITAVKDAVVNFWNSHVGPIFERVKNVLVGSVTWWLNMQIGAVKAVANLVTGVRTWLIDKLGGIWRTVEQKVEAVKGYFFDLYDAVVGNSYVPDMVDGIRDEMARLDAVMVNPAKKATDETTDAFKKMAARSRALLDELFPEIERAKALAEDLNVLDKTVKDRAVLAEARRRRIGIEDKAVISENILGQGALDPLKDSADLVGKTLEELEGKAKIQTVRIAESFADMARNITSSIRGLVDSIKDGGFFDILDGAISLFTQIGQSGVFGADIASALNKAPGFANGTPFHRGGLAVVGERGPELVNLNRGASVMTNGELRSMAGGSRMQVEVVANNNGFGAIVRDQAGQVIAQAAPALIEAGGNAGMAKFMDARSRSLG